MEAWIKPAIMPSPFAHIVYIGRHGQWTSTLGPTQLSAGPSMAGTWNVVRTQSQIQQAMNSVLNGSEPGLIGYWRFDHGSGGTAHDSSSTGNHGTINNAT